MQELGLMIAKMIPFETLLEKLEEDLAKYKIDPSAENKTNLAFYCTMVALNYSMKDKDLMESIKEANHVSRVMDQFKSIS